MLRRMPALLLTHDAGVATLTLDRPPVNALDMPTMQALIDALHQVAQDTRIRVAILTGAGRCFSAGVDLKVQLAAEGAVVGLPEIDVGALGGARHAMRLLGHSTVNRMLLTGRRLGADELARRGAIEACLPPANLLPAALAIAREIAGKDPTAIRLACLNIQQPAGTCSTPERRPWCMPSTRQASRARAWRWRSSSASF